MRKFYLTFQNYHAQRDFLIGPFTGSFLSPPSEIMSRFVLFNFTGAFSSSPPLMRIFSFGLFSFKNFLLTDMFYSCSPLPPQSLRLQ